MRQTKDGFLGGVLQICQPETGHRSGIDAVLLAASIPARAGEKSCELGSGVGVASLCLAHRVAGHHVTGVEINAAHVAQAQANAAANKLTEQTDFITQDIAAGFTHWPLAAASFHHIFANPPFYAVGRAFVPPDKDRQKARLAASDMLDIWIQRACTLVRAKGSVTLIHRADHLADVLAAMRPRLGGIAIKPIAPFAGAPAGRVLVRGMRDSRAALQLHSPFILHKKTTKQGQPHDWHERAEAVLRHGDALIF